MIAKFRIACGLAVATLLLALVALACGRGVEDGAESVSTTTPSTIDGTPGEETDSAAAQMMLLDVDDLPSEFQPNEIVEEGLEDEATGIQGLATIYQRTFERVANRIAVFESAELAERFFERNTSLFADDFPDLDPRFLELGEQDTPEGIGFRTRTVFFILEDDTYLHLIEFSYGRVVAGIAVYSQPGQSLDEAKAVSEELAKRTLERVQGVSQ